ncbi:MAG: flagellar hook-length control protein FliK [Planctomycetota bacterium]
MAGKIAEATPAVAPAKASDAPRTIPAVIPTSPVILTEMPVRVEAARQPGQIKAGKAIPTGAAPLRVAPPAVIDPDGPGPRMAKGPTPQERVVQPDVAVVPDVAQPVAQKGGQPVQAPVAPDPVVSPSPVQTPLPLPVQMAVERDGSPLPQTTAGTARVAGPGPLRGQRAGKPGRPGQFQSLMKPQADVKQGQEFFFRTDSPTAVSQVGRTEPSPVDGQASANAPAPAAERSQADTMVAQVAEQVRVNADRLNRQIEIRLRPPELGTVTLTLQAEGKDIRGVMKVANADTAVQLQIEAPNLFRRLADEGIQMRRLDISLDSEAGSDRPDSPMANPNDGTDQGPLGSRPGLDSDPDGPAGSNETDRAWPQAAAYVTDRSINVWI